MIFEFFYKDFKNQLRQLFKKDVGYFDDSVTPR